MYVTSPIYPRTSETPITPSEVYRDNVPRAQIENAIDIAAAADKCYAPIESFSGQVSQIDAVQAQTMAVSAAVTSASVTTTMPITSAPESPLPAPTVVPLNNYDYGGAQPKNSNMPGRAATGGGFQPAWGQYFGQPCGGALSAQSLNSNPLLWAGAALLVAIGLTTFLEAK